MKEIAPQKEIDNEQSRLKSFSENLTAPEENISVSQANQKLEERLGFGSSVEYSASETLDKKTLELKDEINELLAIRYNTSPEFEKLRSKSKLDRLSALEKIQYAYLSQRFPERAEISPSERRRTNLAYAKAKKYNIDFQIVDTMNLMKSENEIARANGDALSPRESDLYDKLQMAYAKKLSDYADEAIDRATTSLWRT